MCDVAGLIVEKRQEPGLSRLSQLELKSLLKRIRLSLIRSDLWCEVCLRSQTSH